MVQKFCWSKYLSKQLLVISFGLSALVTSAAAKAECGEPVDAKGRVFYVIPEGDLVSRKLTLTVPSCGQGSVVLASEGGWRTETTTFFSQKIAGQTLLVVIFKDPEGKDDNSFLILKGSYIRGNNAAKYWGDMYKLNLPEGVLQYPAEAQKFAELQVLGKFGRHVGGFSFKAPVNQAPAPEQVPAPSFEGQFN